MKIILIPLIMLFELFKRIFYLFLYPVAYFLRKEIRNNNRTPNILWFALDDFIHDEGLKDYNVDVEYCYYGKKSVWVEKLLEGKFKEFARSYYWGAIRNSACNLSRNMAVGNMISIIHHNGTDKIFYEVRQFEKGNFPFIKWEMKSGRYTQAGWITNGRFMVSLFVKK